MKNKSAYIGYTEKEVAQMESKCFVLHFGGDFIFEDGRYVFTKGESNRMYKKTLKDLMGIVKDGSEKDRKYALDLIAGLSIQPMRLQ